MTDASHRFASSALIAVAALTIVVLAGCSPPQGASHSDTRKSAALPQSDDEWFVQGKKSLSRALTRPTPATRARNVIVFIGDGMDISTITAARILAGQQRGQPGEEHVLSFETFPYTGLAKTYNTNQQTPDSAGTATAILAGVKTKAGVIGMTDRARRGNCAAGRNNEVTSIVGLAEQAGLATGIVTTARITHATPAAAYANVPDREWEGDIEIPVSERACKDIARQLVEYAYGDGIDVIFGGGRRYFMPADEADPEDPEARGERIDGNDLIGAWQQANPDGRAYIWNDSQFDALANSPTVQVLGLFEHSHMQYETDRADDLAGEPSLEEMTATAIALLEKKPSGYFLLVEGGRIDHGHHDGNAWRALADTIAFADAVGVAAKMTRESETLIVVTADHGHTMRIVGYPTRGNPILGLVSENARNGEPIDAPKRDLTGRPYTTLAYVNGPGFQGATDEQPAGPKRWPHGPGSATVNDSGRADLSGVDTADKNYLQEAGIPTFGTDSNGHITGSETHSAGDVVIFARGPGAHLLTGVHEQNYIFHVIRFVQQL
ncbi:MAG: alkaline phosphatase [Gammaproteobacteria bacterium]|nr:alkaline phosphatase [Gammaproteobacteria bacterium]